MPTEPVWHCHVPRRCTCTEGLVPDENWSPEYPEETRADPPWPGEGWLVCGICDGDGWYWKRYDRGVTVEALADLFFDAMNPLTTNPQDRESREQVAAAARGFAEQALAPVPEEDR